MISILKKIYRYLFWKIKPMTAIRQDRTEHDARFDQIIHMLEQQVNTHETTIRTLQSLNKSLTKNARIQWADHNEEAWYRPDEISITLYNHEQILLLDSPTLSQ